MNQVPALKQFPVSKRIFYVKLIIDVLCFEGILIGSEGFQELRNFQFFAGAFDDDEEAVKTDWVDEFYEESGNFFCVICDEYFLDEETLDCHLQTHAGENPMVCGFCSERFFDKNSLHTHFLTHSTAATFTCNLCFKHFSSRKFLSEHQRSHHPVSPLPYRTNPLAQINSFGENQEFKFSLQIPHLNVNPTDSNEPEKPTERNSLEKSPGKNQQPTRYCCHICSLNFSRSGDLKRHRRSDEHTKFARNECNECGLRFHSKAALVSHERIHTVKTSKQIPCTECDRRFSFMGDLESHMRSHRDKHFHCPDCQKRFKTNKHLAAHRQLRHTQELGFECPICKKGYALAHHLEKHLPIHKKKINLRCGLCRKSFPTADLLARHELMGCRGADQIYEEMNFDGLGDPAEPGQPLVQNVLSFSQF